MGIKKWGLLLVAAPFLFAAAMALIIFIPVFVMMMMPGAEEEAGSPGGGGAISEIGMNEIPGEFLPVYQAAEERYGVPWNLLAAVHRVETRFSTISPMLSYAGAEGHFQFMPCTWTGWNHPSCTGLGLGAIPQDIKTSPQAIARYGGFGVDGNGDGLADPFDLEDAVYTAASYLAANGADSGDYAAAVFAYNHSQSYVADVLGFMQQYAMSDPVELTPGTGGFSRPLDTQITSRFGYRIHPIYGYSKLHGGIDFACNVGQPIPASKDGQVVYAGWMDANNPNSGYGIYVWVDHGGGYKTTYAHLSTLSVSVGDTVRTGDIVGGCGSTGGSTGPHLHFEIFKNGTLVDPAPYLGV